MVKEIFKINFSIFLFQTDLNFSNLTQANFQYRVAYTVCLSTTEDYNKQGAGNALLLLLQWFRQRLSLFDLNENILNLYHLSRWVRGPNLINLLGDLADRISETSFSSKFDPNSIFFLKFAL